MKTRAGRDLLSVEDLSAQELMKLFSLADRLKGKRTDALKSKNIVMIFQKPSTRTKVSFEVAISQLGGNAISLNWNELQLGRGETVEDTAKVLERYADAIIARVFSHGALEKMAAAASIPVINALSDLEHPCQAIADLYTIRQGKKKFKGLRIAFLGDCKNNTFRSLALAAWKLSMNIVFSCPADYRPDIAGARIEENPMNAVKDADIIYTDTFVSMGDEAEKDRRLADLETYRLNTRLVQAAKKGVMVMHPLPAHRGVEIESKVMDSRNSVVFDQAENRLHTEKAILKFLLG